MSPKSSSRKSGKTTLTPQLPASEKQGMENDEKKRRTTEVISVPLIRPSVDATQPAPRALVDKESIEASARRWGVHQQSIKDQQSNKNQQSIKETSASKRMQTGGKKPQEKLSDSDGPIHKDMLISDIMLNYPQTLEILIAVGLHCIGCQLSAYDSLESGCAIHGMDEKTVAELVKQMNAKLRAEKEEKAKSEKASKQL